MHAPPTTTTRSSWRRKLLVGAGVAAAAVVVFAGPAGAQEIEAADVQTNLDNVFVLLAAVLVIFMQAGFALVEAGLTRAKSVANIMMKNLMDFCAGAIAFWAFGFAFAYNGDTDGIGKFIGSGDWFLGDGLVHVRQRSRRRCSSCSRWRSPPPRPRSCRAPWPSARSSRRTSSTASSSA